MDSAANNTLHILALMNYMAYKSKTGIVVLWEKWKELKKKGN